MKHIRETTTSTNLLIKSGETDRPPGHFLVDCSCGEEYYVRPEEYGPKVTEFEALELAQREHAIKAEQAPDGPLYNLLLLAKSMKVSDPMEIAKKVPGTLNFQAMTDLVYRACLDLFDRIEQLKTEHAQAVEGWGRNDEQVLADNQTLSEQVALLQSQLDRQTPTVVKHGVSTPPSSSGVLPPLTRLIMVAEELEELHQSPDRLDETAGVLREVYSDLKPVVDAVHPRNAYVGDRISASWDIWKDGEFVSRETRVGTVTAIRPAGANFVDFLGDDGLRYSGHHNYEVIERKQQGEQS